MKIMALSGSTRPGSSNLRLIKSLSFLFPQHNFVYYDAISQLPLFQAHLDRSPWPEEVLQWRFNLKEVDAVIISTPEYLHNIPAIIKNALEWLSSSGEIMDKKILPITFTPHAPRGEKAMQSLIWTLNALNARVVTQFPLFQSEIKMNKEGLIENDEIIIMLKEAISLLEN